MVSNLLEYGPILKENYHFRKSTLSKKWGAFFPEKMPLRGMSTRSTGLVFSEMPGGETPKIWWVFSEYYLQVTKIWSPIY